MQIEKVYFESIDNLNLIGLLHSSDKKTDTVIIAIHGLTSNCLKRRDDIIAKCCTENGIDYFNFNNRGNEVICTYDGITNPNMKFYGSGAESVYDSYNDIKAAILEMQKKGYSNIILLGHSMGCTKIVYTYNEFILNNEASLLKIIKGVILLSLVDVPNILKGTLGKNYDKTIKYLKILQRRGKEDKLIVLNENLPIKPNTILQYIEDNDKINFARYSEKDYNFDKLNNIKVPLFMRWGNVNELISQEAGEIVELLNRKIENQFKDINYIMGANHNYTGKEKELSNDIVNFIKKIK